MNPLRGPIPQNTFYGELLPVCCLLLLLRDRYATEDITYVSSRTEIVLIDQRNQVGEDGEEEQCR